MRAALLVSFAVLAPVAVALDLPNPVPDVLAGFVVTTLVPGVAVPTALAFGPGSDGPDLYATTLAGSVERFQLEWTAAGPVASGRSTVATGFNQPLGLAYDGDGLFVADSAAGPESGRVDGRVTRIEGTTRQVVVDGLPNGRHNTNHLRLGPDGRLHVTNGNPNDNGIEGGAPDVLPYSGAILSFAPDQVTASPAILRYVDSQGRKIPPGEIAGHAANADFRAKVRITGSGFRNVFGVAFSPEGVAYTAMNGADSPASQDALFRIRPGADYGFPFCYNEGPPGGVGATVRVVPNPVFPGHDCSGAPPATALLGWHVCATGLDFPTPGPWGFRAEYASSVYVGECGPFFPESLARQTVAKPTTHNTGHKVVRVALDGRGEAVAVEDFITGLALPTDVLFGPDGAMYVADAGAILRVAPATPRLA